MAQLVEGELNRAFATRRSDESTLRSPWNRLDPHFLGELVRVNHHAGRGDGSWGGYVYRSGEVVWPPKPKDYVEPGAGGDK
jgi:hypothetical protein